VAKLRWNDHIVLRRPALAPVARWMLVDVVADERKAHELKAVVSASDRESEVRVYSAREFEERLNRWERDRLVGDFRSRRRMKNSAPAAPRVVRLVSFSD
jgi:hypothetical protein